MRCAARLWLLILAAAAGCQLPWQTSHGRIVRVELWTTFTVLKARTPAEGHVLPVRIRLYEVSEKDPEQVRAVKARGDLQLVMYKGRVNRVKLAKAQPQEVFTYSPRQLERYVIRTVVGWEYIIELKVPKADAVTVRARYMPAKGEPIFSAPTTLPIGPK